MFFAPTDQNSELGTQPAKQRVADITSQHRLNSYKAHRNQPPPSSSPLPPTTTTGEQLPSSPAPCLPTVVAIILLQAVIAVESKTRRANNKLPRRPPIHEVVKGRPHHRVSPLPPAVCRPRCLLSTVREGGQASTFFAIWGASNTWAARVSTYHPNPPGGGSQGTPRASTFLGRSLGSQDRLHACDSSGCQGAARCRRADMVALQVPREGRGVATSSWARTFSVVLGVSSRLLAAYAVGVGETNTRLAITGSCTCSLSGMVR